MHVESTYDVLKRKCASNCTSVGTAKGSTSYKGGKLDAGSEQAEELSRHGREKGWALKKPKVGVNFTKSVKEFLNQTFLKSEETGKKPIHQKCHLSLGTSGPLMGRKNCLKGLNG